MDKGGRRDEGEMKKEGESSGFHSPVIASA